MDPDKLQNDFDTLDIKPFEKTIDIQTAIGNWTVKVNDVVSRQVCTVLCLDHEKKSEINAWYYYEVDQVCHCGWMDSVNCPEDMVESNWSLDDGTNMINNAFVQLHKTVPCGMLFTAPYSEFLCIYDFSIIRLPGHRLSSQWRKNFSG